MPVITMPHQGISTRICSRPVLADCQSLIAGFGNYLITKLCTLVIASGV
jgi:hypothetical protein